jgi:hypothetical protein
LRGDNPRWEHFCDSRYEDYRHTDLPS